MVFALAGPALASHKVEIHHAGYTASTAKPETADYQVNTKAKPIHYETASGDTHVDVQLWLNYSWDAGYVIHCTKLCHARAYGYLEAFDDSTEGGPPTAVACTSPNTCEDNLPQKGCSDYVCDEPIALQGRVNIPTGANGYETFTVYGHVVWKYDENEDGEWSGPLEEGLVLRDSAGFVSAGYLPPIPPDVEIKIH